MRRLGRGERRRGAALAAAVLALHVAGFGILLLLVAPHRFHLGAQGTFGLGLGVTAYTLGLRHAFDADHIAAIDNATRKLMSDGKRPLSVGFFFSLGHSTVVFALAGLLALGFGALGDGVRSGSLSRVGSVVGTGVSGAFLYLIAALNLAILIGIVRHFRAMRRGVHDPAELERRLDARGLVSRVCRRFTRTVDAPWKMYPVGFLFGLGFDTASEVALLFLAAGAASTGLPFYAIVCLPILFAAGMSLLDTLDGAFMSVAYGWALSEPVRKVYFNIALTGLSVAVALIVGTVELASIAADKLDLRGGLWHFVSTVDLNKLGFVIVALFVLTWALAVAVWRLARIEDRWSGGIRRS